MNLKLSIANCRPSEPPERNNECRMSAASCVMRHSFFSRAAFTLLELMIAIAIFSVVLGTIYSTWLLIMRASRVTQTVAAQVQRQRVAIRTIEQGLTSIESFQASMEYYSFIVDNGGTPTLSFTARLPGDFPRNGKFGDFDVRRLTFSLEPGANSENDLVLRQKPILMDMDDNEKKYPLVLARNVQTFAVECWDTNADDWVDEWDDTNSIPPLIRVTLVLGGHKNTDNLAGNAPALSITRVIAVPSQTLPAVVQTGGGAVGLPIPGGPGINLPVPNKGSPGGANLNNSANGITPK
jgi:prepilin-type N-terminal cleavage/methylation domain-containing protein